MLSQSKIFNSHKKFQKPPQILLIIFYFIDDSVGKRVNNQQLKKKKALITSALEFHFVGNSIRKVYHN
jgi:hypothetical protein